MALPPQFLDELRARTPLPGLIGRKARLVRNGRNWKGCCPFHNEKTPSFYVYDDHYHCFGCGAHGDAIAFLMQAEGASFPEAVERLAGEAGLEVPKPSPEARAREARARDLHGVLAAAEAAFRRRLFAPEGAEGLAYLRRRGLAEATIARFGLGWSGEGRGGLAAELGADGVSPDQLLEAGLLQEREDGSRRELFYNRVMFPIRDRRGRVISFGGRMLGDGQPKYVNGPETALFQKRRTLFGLDLAREAAFRGAPLVVVEGYMDVIALWQAGGGASGGAAEGAARWAPVAPLGTALTAEQLEALWAVSPEPVLCFDGDGAGARAAAKAAEVALPLLAPERTLRLAALSGGEDPDTLVQRQGAGAFATVLAAARPLSEALFGLLTEGRPAITPEQRAAIRNRLAAAAGTIPDKALAAEYRRALFDRFFAAGRPQRPQGAGAAGGRPGARAGAGPGGRPALRRPACPPIEAEAVRLERARNLVAILLRHPALLEEVAEALGGLELPGGVASMLRDALLRMEAGGGRLDFAGLMDHLAATGLAEAAAWALRPAGLAAAAGAGAQPAEALDGWWHFYALLRGEAALLAERAEAERQLAEGNDPQVQLRLIRLAEALAAHRTGEVGLG